MHPSSALDAADLARYQNAIWQVLYVCLLVPKCAAPEFNEILTHIQTRIYRELLNPFFPETRFVIYCSQIQGSSSQSEEEILTIPTKPGEMPVAFFPGADPQSYPMTLAVVQSLTVGMGKPVNDEFASFIHGQRQKFRPDIKDIFYRMLLAVPSVSLYRAPSVPLPVAAFLHARLASVLKRVHAISLKPGHASLPHWEFFSKLFQDVFDGNAGIQINYGRSNPPAALIMQNLTGVDANFVHTTFNIVLTDRVFAASLDEWGWFKFFASATAPGPYQLFFREADPLHNHHSQHWLNDVMNAWRTFEDSSGTYTSVLDPNLDPNTSVLIMDEDHFLNRAPGEQAEIRHLARVLRDLRQPVSDGDLLDN